MLPARPVLLVGRLYRAAAQRPRRRRAAHAAATVPHQRAQLLLPGVAAWRLASGRKPLLGLQFLDGACRVRRHRDLSARRHGAHAAVASAGRGGARPLRPCRARARRSGTVSWRIHRAHRRRPARRLRLDREQRGHRVDGDDPTIGPDRPADGGLRGPCGRRERQRDAGRNARRARAARARAVCHGDRLFRHAGQDRRGLAQPLAPYRRPGDARRRRLLSLHRSHEGRHPSARREHLLVRGRAGAGVPSGGLHRRRLSGIVGARGGRGHGRDRAQGRRPAERDGADPLLRGQDVLLRRAAFHRVRRRCAAHRERQGPEVQAAGTRALPADLGPRRRRHHAQALGGPEREPLGQHPAIDRAFPRRDHDRRKRIAQNVDRDEARRHQAMHAENDSDRGHRHRARRCQSGHQHHDRRSRDAGAALGRDQQDAQQAELLPQRQVDADGLRQEHGGGREIEAGAVMIEGIAGRQHQAHDRFLAAEAGELVDELRKDRFRRARPHHDQQLRADVLNQAPEADPVPGCDRPEHEADKQKAGQVELAHHGTERDERADAEAADGEADRAHGADRRQPHDVSDDLEDDPLGELDHLDHRGAVRADRMQAECEQHREEYDLQHVALGEG